MAEEQIREMMKEADQGDGDGADDGAGDGEVCNITIIIDDMM